VRPTRTGTTETMNCCAGEDAPLLGDHGFRSPAGKKPEAVGRKAGSSPFRAALGESRRQVLDDFKDHQLPRSHAAALGPDEARAFTVAFWAESPPLHARSAVGPDSRQTKSRADQERGPPSYSAQKGTSRQTRSGRTDKRGSFPETGVRSQGWFASSPIPTQEIRHRAAHDVQQRFHRPAGLCSRASETIRDTHKQASRSASTAREASARSAHKPYQGIVGRAVRLVGPKVILS